MPTVSNITTTYAGEDLKKWVSAALLEGNTLAKNLITIVPNVKYKGIVKRLELTGGLVANDCDFSPSGSYTLTERYWNPVEMKLNKQLCKQDFHSTWEAAEQGYSAFDVLPKTFSDYLVALQVAAVAAEIETMIWQGDSAVSGFDGFIKLLENDADLPAAQEVAGVAITAANCVEEMSKLVDSIPNRLKGKLKIFIAKNIKYAFIRALGGFGANGLGANGYEAKGSMWFAGQPLFFEGYELVEVEGLPDDVMIAAQKENLMFMCGLLGDHSEVKLIDTSATLGDDNVRIIMKLTGCVNYAVSEDICVYGITNAVN